MITYSYPLAWPEGWERTIAPVRSQFQVDLAQAVSDLAEQLRLLGAELPILSSNLVLRNDGRPRERQPYQIDPGVAVYFQLDGHSQVMARDRYETVTENIRAIGKIIEAMRGIERWGGLAMRGRAFEGFKALPGRRQWWEVLGLHPGASLEEVKAARNRLARIYHPDSGTQRDTGMMAEVNRAYEEAKGVLVDASRTLDNR